MGRSISKPSQSIVIFGLLAIYFGSGFAALLYQVVWQRMLAFFSGADLYATTTIVASFMAGLGFGSLCAGWLADRLSVRGQIYAFAFAEFLCGTLGLISKWWYYDVLYVRFGHIAYSNVSLAAILFTSLLLPTFLMGMTFPLLAKALTPAVELAGKRIGSLYAVNTLGAAFGALTTAWVLLGAFDLPQILQMAAAIDIAIGVAAIALCAGSTGISHLLADPYNPALVHTTR